MADRSHAYFELCRSAMGMTQEQLGRAIGISRRTALRWTASGTQPYAFPALARLVQSRDAALAAEIAATAGITLETPGTLPKDAPALVDSVVCAAADAMGATPGDVRPALHAALRRAREMGLAADTVERVLATALESYAATRTKRVTSGGAPTRAGGPTVPKPRLT